jgi:hypothetical protein
LHKKISILFMVGLGPIMPRATIRVVPQNFLIDPTGKIIAKNLMGDDLEDKLNELLAKMKIEITRTGRLYGRVLI